MDLNFRNACRNGNLPYIQKYLSENIEYFKYFNDPIHPVFICSSRGNLDCIKYLLTKYNITEICIYDSIKIAAISNHYDTVNYLFHLIKNINIFESKLIFSLYKSIIKQNKSIITFLINENIYYYDDTYNSLFACCIIGDIETIKMIINKYNCWKKFKPKCLELSIKYKKEQIYSFLFNL